MPARTGVSTTAARQLEQIGLPVHQDRLEAPLEQMAASAMAPDRSLREHAVQRFDHQIVVLVHQAVGVAPPVESLDHRRHHRQDGLPIIVVIADRLATVAAGRDVVDRTREFDAEGSGHVLNDR